MILGVVGDETVDVMGRTEFTKQTLQTVFERSLTKGLRGVITNGNPGVERHANQLCESLGISHFAFSTLIDPLFILDFIDILVIIRHPLKHNRLDLIENSCNLPMLKITLDGKQTWKNL